MSLTDDHSPLLSKSDAVNVDDTPTIQQDQYTETNVPVNRTVLDNEHSFENGTLQKVSFEKQTDDYSSKTT